MPGRKFPPSSGVRHPVEQLWPTELTKELRISDPRTNDRIRVPEVRLVGPNGEQVGVVRIEDAIRLAQEADLDLVEVAPNSKPPVAKIMDFGKFKYETAQKAKEAKRNQSNTILKEVRFRLKIDVHDYETKRKRAEGFLKTGDKVKAMILFRGREQSRPEQGVRLLQRFAEDVSEFGTVESTPTIDGRNMVMVIGPLKTKAEVKAEHDAKIAKSKPERPERPAGEGLPALPPESVKAATDAAANPPVARETVPVAAPEPVVSAPAAAPAAVEAAPEAAPTVAPAAKVAPAASAPDAPATKAAPAARTEPPKVEPTTPASAEAKAQAPKAPTPKPATPMPRPTPGSVPKPRAVAPKTAPENVTSD
jgi:translation initiation factor IF-3